jgi:hypothetical protein
LKVKKYQIEFIIKVSKDATSKQVEEWARFVVGDKGKLSNDNPFYDDSFDTAFGTFKIKEIEE